VQLYLIYFKIICPEGGEEIIFRIGDQELHLLHRYLRFSIVIFNNTDNHIAPLVLFFETMTIARSRPLLLATQPHI
jgi:hypothetical protein